MTINELRLHLVNECTKVTLECSICQGTLRRPWKKHHDCRLVYRERLQRAERTIREQDEVI